MKDVIRVDSTRLRPDRLEAVQQWVRSLGVDPADVRPTFAILKREREWELHLSRFRRNGASNRWLDHATNDCVSEPLIVGLGPDEDWPSFEGGIVQ